MDPGTRLLAWFSKHARDLPWRAEPRNPYRVLISEIMLQQTQVDRVVPIYERFVKRFPSFVELAAAEEDEVLSAWTGLGYYRRARLLHRLARTVVAAGGDLPRSSAALEELPGIGPYTAAAIASLAFGEAVSVLDGNVMRIAARVNAYDVDPRSAAGKAALGDWTQTLMQSHPSGFINEALMELGALVCRPRSPDCPVCPLRAICRAESQQNQESFPRPRVEREKEQHRWLMVCCIDPESRWLLKRVSSGPILRGLWLPPWTALPDPVDLEAAATSLLPFPATVSIELLEPIRHSITHRLITVHPALIELKHAPAMEFDPEWCWTPPGAGNLPTSTLLSKLHKAFVSRN